MSLGGSVREGRKLPQADVAVVPRFANVATFMRTEQRDSGQGLDVALFGVPLDLGCSFRSGARHGPSSMREMSRLIREAGLETGIAPFDICSFADVGNAPVNPLDLDDSVIRIEEFVRSIVRDGTIPLAVGGDHTVMLPILRGLAPASPLALIQFEAHSVGVTIIGMAELEDRGLSAVSASISDAIGDRSAYLTFDIDALDPTVAPGTGGLEPGGLSYRDAQRLLHGLRGLNIVAADVVEVCPPLENGNLTALAAANVMFEELCLIADMVTRQSRNLQT